MLAGRTEILIPFEIIGIIKEIKWLLDGIE